MTRRLHIDWLRGVAVLCMVLWHVVDAWTLRAGRDTAGFGAVVFIGGWAAPFFLFLAGVSVPLAAAARVGRGASRVAAARALRWRGWQVFGLAHLFRFQSFVLNPGASWSSLLKPDILNILGLGLVLAATLWRHALGRRGIGIWLVAPAVVIVVVLAPWAHTWWWPTLLYPRLEAYIRPVGNYGVFSLFPSLAYVLVGTGAGEWLAVRGDSGLRPIGAIGTVAVAAGLLATVGIGPASGQWLAPTYVFLWRAGALAVMLAVSRTVLAWAPGQATGLLVLFGQTSLFVYWVHVELAYGILSYPLHHALELQWSLVGYVSVVLVMGRCASLWARRSTRAPWIPVHMVARA